METKETQPSNQLAIQTINYWKIVGIFISRWYWVASAAIIALLVAWIYLRTARPTYITTATLQLEDKQSPNVTASQFSSAAAAAVSLVQTGGIIMRSEEVILKAIGDLDYKISYYIEGRIRTTESYPFVPFKVNIIKQDTLNFSRQIYFVQFNNDNTFGLSTSSGLNKSYIKLKYGQVINLGNMLFSISTKIPNKGSYSFKFNSKLDFFGRATKGLNTTELERGTNIMSVTHTDENPIFSADLLNAIIKEYIKNDAELKKRSSIQTVNYLNTQIGFLDGEVNKSGDNLAKASDPEKDKVTNTAKLSDYEKQIADLQLQDNNIRQLEVQLQNNKDKTQLNLELEGIKSSSLSQLINQYNILITERETQLLRLIPSAKPIKDLENQIGEIRLAIKSNITILRGINEKTINYYYGKKGAVSQSLNQIPTQLNDFSKLKSNFDANQKIASMLFERKLAAQINAASIISGARIINNAQPAKRPISPIPKKTYTSFLFIGIFAGLGLIILVRTFNPFIYDVETVEGLTNTPIIGVILKYPNKLETGMREILSIAKPRSVFAESVRSVRTNLSFMASHKNNKVICITSEISGEGKSFVTVNLASTMAIIDKKVIVLAADLRRSKLHKIFGSTNKKGLSTYLSAKNTIEEIIEHDEINNIDYISSGPVPPNPSELLHSSAMQVLLDYLKTNYEYILIDTAPVGLVSDSIPLIRNSDINLFIIRSGVSKFKAINIPKRLENEYKLNNFAIILNSFGDEKLHANIYSTNYALGNSQSYYFSDYKGYGYNSYYQDNNFKKWWQFWKKNT